MASLAPDVREAVRARLCGPPNPAAREHVGIIQAIKWSDPDSGAIIAALTDGHTVKGRSGAESIERGQQYRFLGRWVENERFGPQFQFDTFALRVPVSRAAVVRYLTKICDGIGERSAERLFDRFGSETVPTLRENPDGVAGEGLLKEDVARDAAESLRKESQFEATKLELFDLFAGRGFPADTLIKRAIEEWGAKAPERIRRNPFSLMVNEMPGCGYKRCDRLYLDLKYPPLRLKRQMLAAWHSLHTDTSGHTWFPLLNALSTVRQSIGVDCSPELAVLLGLRAKWLRHRRDEHGRQWIAERNRASNEQVIADSIARLRAHSKPMWPFVATAHNETERAPSEHQAAAIRQFATSPVGLLIGTPGTGKTFTAAAIIRKVIEQFGEDAVAVAAPTGKAAVRCMQAMKANGATVSATTVHRLLGLGTAFAEKGESGAFNEFNPLPFQFVIVDESSMLDVDLAAALFRALPDTANVLLIGDPYQLPPVGHGAPLRDMIAAGVACGELTEIRRNAGLIVRACAAIKDGRRFETAAKYDPDTGDNLRHFEMADDNETLEGVEELLLRFMENRTFDPVWQTQVLVAVNDRGHCSRKILNDRLQKLLNPDGVRATPNPFAVGDKVICLKNGRYTRVREPEKIAGGPNPIDPNSYQPKRTMLPGGGVGGPEEHYVANGEIGRVVAVNANVFIARFSEDDALVKVVVGKKKESDSGDSVKRADGSGEDEGGDKGRGCNFDLAYAITTHKAQGSESPCVIVVVDEAGGRVSGREWWYTALSRASKLCVTIGRRAVLDKQAKRITLKARKTFLAELIRESSIKSPVKGETHVEDIHEKH